MKISSAERQHSRKTGCCKCGHIGHRHAYYPDYIDYEGKSKGRYLCKVCVQFWTFNKFGDVVRKPTASPSSGEPGSGADE